MAHTTYGQFCPVAMAAEILCTRWTVVLLRELIAGSSRFNDLRRGLPRMSPALLSQRLKELEASGIIHRQPSARDAGAFDYRLTEAGRELEPLVEAFGLWGHRWVDSELSLQRLDAQLLMWTCDATSIRVRSPSGERSSSSAIPSCQRTGAHGG